MQANEPFREPFRAAMPKAREPKQPSLGGLIGRTVDLAQKVAVDELRLLRVESREMTTSILVRAALGGVAGLCFLFAWIALCATVVVLLEPYLLLAARLGIIAGAHLVLGIGLLLFVRRGDAT